MTHDHRTMAHTPAIRAAMVIAAFRDSHADTTLVATADGGAARLTHGDLRQLVGALVSAENRLDRIAAWHSRETGPAGMVGDYCNECGARWPCETRRMADGTHEDLAATDQPERHPDAEEMTTP